MKLCKHRRDHALAFSMTPMIDIVFLLLIFFMTVSQISQVNRQFLQLPQVGSFPAESTRLPIVIHVTQSGSYFREGREREWEQLAAELSAERAAAGSDPNALSLLLRCDRRCPSAAVNRLLAHCRSLGIQFIRAAVLE